MRHRGSRYRRLGWMGALALLGWAGTAVAQGTPGGTGAGATGSAPEARRADPIVVTTTRSEEPSEQVGASITVVPEAFMQIQEFRSVDEALRAVPGVQILRSGGPGAITTVQIRGANATQVQVLIDGVRVKSLTSGDFDFSDINLDNVERVEVLRGPQSTLYGADAIGGVINIITKRGRGAPSAWVDLEAGNYGTFRERLGASGSWGPWGFSLGASRLDFGGQYDNDQYDLTSVNMQITRALPNQGELALIGRYSASNRGIPFRTVFPDFDPNAEQKDRLGLVSLSWRQPVTEMYESRMRVSYVDETLEFRDQADPDQPFVFPANISSRRFEAEWYHFLNFGTIDTVTLGAEYRSDRGENEGNFSQTIDSYALVAQNQLRLWDRLFVTAGVRYDGNSEYEDKTTVRAAVSYLVKETDTRIKASWGQGFRAPTFNELFFPAFAPCPPFGNTALKPEESESWDAGVEQNFWGRRARLAATYFHNDFDNLIQSTLTDPVNFCFQAQNVARARTQGVEVEASVEPVDGLSLVVAYTYTDTEDRTTGQELRRFAPNRVAFTATWQPIPGLSLGAEVLYTSSQFEGAGQPRNPGYTVVNAAASYRLPWHWKWLSDIVLHLKVNNLFNEDYAEVPGFPALGTYVVGGIRATFQ